MPYSPSERHRKFVAKYRHSAARRAWAKVAWGSVALMRYDNPDQIKEEAEEEGVQPEIIDESGPTVRLMITKSRQKRPTTIDLTMLTEVELIALRKVFIIAFDEALPTVRLRDQEAQNAYAEGDDSIVRLYRPVPEFVDREGESRQHDQSLWSGLEDVPQRSLIDRAGDGG